MISDTFEIFRNHQDIDRVARISLIQENLIGQGVLDLQIFVVELVVAFDNIVCNFHVLMDKGGNRICDHPRQRCRSSNG